MFFYEDDPVYFYLKGEYTAGLVTDVICDDYYYEQDNEKEGSFYYVSFHDKHENRIDTVLLTHHELTLASDHILTEELKVGDKIALLDTFIFKMRPEYFNPQIESFEEVAGRIVTIIDIDSPCGEDFRIPLYRASLQGTTIIVADYDINIAKTLQINSARLEMSSVHQPKLPQI